MKSFLIKFVLSVNLFLLLVVTVNYILDPLYFYRFPSFYEPQYSTNARFQIPGFIRNAEYDTVLVGTSMSRNFQESHVDEILGGTSLNAALPASTAREQKLAVELALGEEKVERVLWEINMFSFARPIEDVEDEQNDFPYHLWDRTWLNDYKYLFSVYPLEQMKRIIEENRAGSVEHKDREMLYKFGFDNPPLTLDKVRELVNIPNGAARSDYRYDIMLPNFQANVVETVKAHPEVQFVFFHPPYALFWHVRAQKQLDQYIQEVTKTKIAMFQELSSLPNVKLYDFSADQEITHKVSNYMDIAHYFPVTNDWILQQIASEPPVLTEEEAIHKAKSVEEQVLQFDEQDLILP